MLNNLDAQEKNIQPESSIRQGVTRYVDILNSIQTRQSLLQDVADLEEQKHALHQQLIDLIGDLGSTNWMIALEDARRHETTVSRQVSHMLRERLGINVPVFHGEVPFYYGGFTPLEKVYPNFDHTVVINLINTCWEYTPELGTVIRHKSIDEAAEEMAKTYLDDHHDEYPDVRVVSWPANMHTDNTTLDVSLTPSGIS